MDGIHISLAAEPIGTFFGLPITNTLITSWVVMAILVLTAFFVGRSISLVPGKLQTVFEWLFEGVHDFIGTTLENRHITKFMFPLLLTLFLFIGLSNAIEFTPGIGSVGFYRQVEQASAPVSPSTISEQQVASEEVSTVASEGAEDATALATTPTEGHAEAEVEFVPLFRSVNTDLNVTLALTIITVIMIEVMGIVALGFFRYAGKFINFSSPLNFIVGIIELVSEISRLISFSFRLFGNIFAGEVLLAVASFFLPYVLPVPLMAFETFVGFVQAAVFALLALFFTKMAIAEPHGAHAQAH